MTPEQKQQALEKTAEICKKFEGFRAEPYKCPAGVWTIGYGCTRYPDGKKVQPTDPVITIEQAHDLLLRMLQDYQSGVLGHCPGIEDVGLLAACTDLAYNIGTNAFGSSTVRKRINSGDMAGVPDAFRMWVKAAGKTLPGLVKRREAEIAII